MAGKPGGSAPGGVPTFWAPPLGPVGQQPDTTHIPRAPTYVSRWELWQPPGGTYGHIDFIIAGAPRTVSATASAGGLGTASAVGINVFPAIASAAGTGTASAVGAGTDAATASAAGIGGALLTTLPEGTSGCLLEQEDNGGYLILEDATGFLELEICDAVLARAPVYTPTWPVRYRIENLGWISQRTATPGILAATASAAGVGAASAVGAGGTGTSAIARAPVFTPTWPLRYRIENLGWLDHLSIEIIPPHANYDWPNPRGVQWPVSLYTWIGGRVGVAAAGNTGVASAAGVGTAIGVSSGTAASTASAAGQGNASAVGTGINASIASAAGLGTATGVGFGSTASIGNAAGLGTATGVGVGLSLAVANAAGTGTAIGAGAASGTISGVANAAGLGTASGISAVTIAAVFNASGQGSAIGVPPGVAGAPGGAGVVHTFSRKRWRELQALIAAEMAAVAKADRLTTDAKREPLLQAARAAAAAVDAAEAEGENDRLDKLLLRNAQTLRRAIRANTEVKLLRETASAIEQSRGIVARGEEDEEMISLLLML